MNQRKILLQLLPGFIPLFVFIVADEIWGTKIGLLVAVAFGIAELFFYWIKYKKFDKFILFDTLLIVGLGIVSLILENELFFKLKPAFIGVLICTILAISAFTPKNILLTMSKRYLKGVEFNNDQYKHFQNKLKIVFWLILVYTLLVFYSAKYMSDEAWAFISGGLFYIFIGMYFVYEFIKTRVLKNKMMKEEFLPLVNEKGEVIGKASRTACHSNKANLHPVVHLHVFNNKGELYLQKRPVNKLVQPGKWDTAVGGHISFGENLETGLKREAREEIGIQDFKPSLVSSYVWESDIERELVFCFVTNYNGPFIVNKEELSDGKFWTLDDLKSEIGKGTLTSNFEKEFTDYILPMVTKSK